MMPAPEQPYFRHEPLDTTTGSVRLLRLLDGPDDSTICCELFQTTIPIKQTYSALSYEWGDPTPAKTINVNETEFVVQPNLHAFLWQLRSNLRKSAEDKDSLPVILWVDAICIDQHSVSERNHQVGLMNQIYSQAKQTIAWLGEEADGSSELARLINHHICQLQTESPGRDVTTLSEAIAASIEIDPQWRQACYCLTQFVHRSYWARVWIIQEVTLASCVILCVGADQLPHGSLTLLAALMTDNFMLKNLRSFHELWIVRGIGQLVRKKTKHSIMQLTYAFRDSRCTVAHDKVYGILAMIPQSMSLPVNYEMSLHSLFFQTLVQEPVIQGERVRSLLEALGLVIYRGPFDRTRSKSWSLDFWRTSEHLLLEHPRLQTPTVLVRASRELAVKSLENKMIYFDFGQAVRGLYSDQTSHVSDALWLLGGLNLCLEVSEEGHLKGAAVLVKEEERVLGREPVNTAEELSVEVYKTHRAVFQRAAKSVLFLINDAKDSESGVLFAEPSGRQSDVLRISMELLLLTIAAEAFMRNIEFQDASSKYSLRTVWTAHGDEVNAMNSSSNR
jgi:hypothetical protein